MAISLPRICSHSRSVLYFATSMPPYIMEPESTHPFVSSIPVNVFVSTDLPDADSPTMHKLSPLYTSKDASRMAVNSSPRKENFTTKSSTVRTFSLFSYCARKRSTVVSILRLLHVVPRVGRIGKGVAQNVQRNRNNRHHNRRENQLIPH